EPPSGSRGRPRSPPRGIEARGSASPREAPPAGNAARLAFDPSGSERYFFFRAIPDAAKVPPRLRRRVARLQRGRREGRSSRPGGGRIGGGAPRGAPAGLPLPLGAGPGPAPPSPRRSLAL